jgi:hypothetical protein
VSLFVGDLVGPGSGPIEFIDGSGIASSGLTFVFGGLGDLADDVDFSTDGSDWAYVPMPDGAGFDPGARFVRIRPSGRFVAGVGVAPTQFRLRMRVRVD